MAAAILQAYCLNECLSAPSCKPACSPFGLGFKVKVVLGVEVAGVAVGFAAVVVAWRELLKAGAVILQGFMDEWEEQHQLSLEFTAPSKKEVPVNQAYLIGIHLDFSCSKAYKEPCHGECFCVLWVERTG